MDAAQQAVFGSVAIPVYNCIAYPVGIALTIYLLLPVARCRRRLLAGEAVPPKELERSRRRLVNVPFYQVGINFLGWLPGAVVFPLVICWLGGGHNAEWIWIQFVLSFIVSALLTTAQTFFVLEWFLMGYFYADFFKDARPSDIRGVVRVPFWVRGPWSRELLS